MDPSSEKSTLVSEEFKNTKSFTESWLFGGHCYTFSFHGYMMFYKISKNFILFTVHKALCTDLVNTAKVLQRKLFIK